jgi:hypothetical protein
VKRAILKLSKLVLQLERICIYLVNKIVQTENQTCTIRGIHQMATNLNCECEIWYGYDLTTPIYAV